MLEKCFRFFDIILYNAKKVAQSPKKMTNFFNKSTLTDFTHMEFHLGLENSALYMYGDIFIRFWFSSFQLYYGMIIFIYIIGRREIGAMNNSWIDIIN